MTDVDDINEALATNVTKPASVTVAGETVTSKSADELIKAANHLAANSADGAGSKPHRGFRFTQLIPPGSG